MTFRGFSRGLDLQSLPSGEENLSIPSGPPHSLDAGRAPAPLANTSELHWPPPSSQALVSLFVLSHIMNILLALKPAPPKDVNPSGIE